MDIDVLMDIDIEIIVGACVYMYMYSLDLSHWEVLETAILQKH